MSNECVMLHITGPVRCSNDVDWVGIQEQDLAPQDGVVAGQGGGYTGILETLRGNIVHTLWYYLMTCRKHNLQFIMMIRLSGSYCS